MNGHPLMPDPAEELARADLPPASGNGRTGWGMNFELSPHASEFGRVTVRDLRGEYTTTLIPNVHHGRRLRKDQVRYVVQEINNSWRN